MDSIQLCFRQHYSSEAVVSFTTKPDVLLMTESFKLCQIDHRSEHFVLLFMLLTISAQVSLSDSQTQF